MMQTIKFQIQALVRSARDYAHFILRSEKMETLPSLLLLLFLCDYGSAGDGPVVQTKYGKVSS